MKILKQQRWKDGKTGPKMSAALHFNNLTPLKPTPASDYYWCTYSWPNLPTKKINLESSCKAIFLDSSAEEIFLDSSGEEIFLDSSAEDIFLDSFGEEISLDSSAEEIFLDSSGEEMERPRLWLAGGWLPCSRLARQPPWILPGLFLIMPIVFINVVTGICHCCYMDLCKLSQGLVTGYNKPESCLAPFLIIPSWPLPFQDNQAT